MFIYKFPCHSYFQQSSGGAGEGDVGVGEVDKGGEAFGEVLCSYLFVYPLVRALAVESVAGDAGGGAVGIFGAVGGGGHGSGIAAVGDVVAGGGEGFA